jgi:molybdopterin converting factor small subunit
VTVKVKIPYYLQTFTDKKDSVQVECSSVNECLQCLAEQFPDVRKMLFNENGELHNHMLNRIAVFINGRHVYPDAINRPVADGDEIDILYVISGG